MKFFALFSLVCVLAIGVQCQAFTEQDFEDLETGNFKTLPPLRTTTVTKRPRTTTTTPRARIPVTPTPLPPVSSTPWPNPTIDGNGQLLGCPCLSTQESNSVCGTDGNTYGNPSKLKCAQRCGHQVEVNFLGSCRGRKPLTLEFLS